MKILGILVSLFFVGLGVLSLALGVVNYNQEEHFFATAEQATGTITEFSYVSRGEYCALIEFTTKGGQFEQYVNTGDCASSQNSSRIGQTVQVYYDPEKPGNTIQVRGLTGTEGSGLITGIIGCAVLVFVGLIGFLVTFLVTRVAAMNAGQSPQHPAAYLARAQQLNNKRAEQAAGIKAGDSPLVREEKLKAMQDELERKIEENRRQLGQ